MKLWHSWVTYLVKCERTFPNKGGQKKPVQINFKFRKTCQFSFSNTIHKIFDDHLSGHAYLLSQVAALEHLTQNHWEIWFRNRRLLTSINGKLPERKCLTTEIITTLQALRQNWFQNQNLLVCISCSLLSSRPSGARWAVGSGGGRLPHKNFLTICPFSPKSPLNVPFLKI